MESQQIHNSNYHQQNYHSCTIYAEKIQIEKLLDLKGKVSLSSSKPRSNCIVNVNSLFKVPLSTCKQSFLVNLFCAGGQLATEGCNVSHKSTHLQPNIGSKYQGIRNKEAQHISRRPFQLFMLCTTITDLQTRQNKSSRDQALPHILYIMGKRRTSAIIW